MPIQYNCFYLPIFKITNKQKIAVALIAILFVLSFFLSRSAQAATAGEKTYQQCIACHGDKAQGNDALNAPALAGQFSWYLTRQLNHFKKSLRGDHAQDNFGQQMAVTVKTLNIEQDLPALTAYLASLTLVTLENDQAAKNISVAGENYAEDNYDSHKNGSRYYQAKCGACHGGQAQGNKAFNAPKLNGLTTAYLLRQMKHFSTGIRGTHQEDKFGRQMAMMAKTTSGSELDDIVFYITHQSHSAEK